MDVTFRCPTCQSALSVDPSRAETVACPDCDTPIPFQASQSLKEKNLVDVCPRCEKSAFYVQRDFNQRLGLAVMLGFALVGLVFVAYDRAIGFYACLAAGALTSTR